MKKIMILMILCLILTGCGKKAEVVQPQVVAQAPTAVQPDVQPQNQVVGAPIVAEEPQQEVVEPQQQGEVYKGMYEEKNNYNTGKRKIACAKCFSSGDIVEYRCDFDPSYDLKQHFGLEGMLGYVRPEISIIKVYHSSDDSDGFAVNYVSTIENDKHIEEKIIESFNDDSDYGDMYINYSDMYINYGFLNTSSFVLEEHPELAYANDYLAQNPNAIYLISPFYRDDINELKQAAENGQWDYCWNYIDNCVESGRMYYRVLSWGRTDVESMWSDGEYRWWEQFNQFMNGKELNYLGQ